MILYITPENKHLYKAQLQEMYELRYRVFKKRLNWQLQTKDAQEKDSYDNKYTCYVLYLDKEKKVRGCVRVIPTSRRYMIKNTFSAIRPIKPLPVNSNIWEISRFAVDNVNTQAPRIGTISQITYLLCAGLLEFALANKISKYIFVAGLGMESVFKKIGWFPNRLSHETEIGGMKCVMAQFIIKAEDFIHIIFEGKFTPFFSLNAAKLSKKASYREANFKKHHAS